MYHDNIYRIDYSFYDILYSINELFMKHNSIKFISRIGNKSYPDTVNQTILYYNNIDKTEKYTIIIHNKYSIRVTCPIKKSNSLYTTVFYTLEDVYNYLYLHLCV